MRPPISNTLTFDLVDDICLGLQSGALTWKEVPRFFTKSIGPLFEMVEIIGDQRFNEIGAHKELVTARSQNLPIWFGTYDKEGIVRVRRLLEDQLVERNFFIRTAQAAQSAGFSREDSWKLTAAIGEIYSNTVDHSENIDSAYVAYSAKCNEFEFVVSDSGIGVLNSLTRNPMHAHIADAGTALELALREGVSRWQEPGHGFGFKPILVGLANISTRMRFRSGDFGRELQRTVHGTIAANTSQSAKIKGLFCSVLCVARDIKAKT